MILRRFMKHASDQNWFAVVLDLFVVVTGIFLGLQVNEWNEDRKTENDWNLALARVHTEITNNIDRLKPAIEETQLSVNSAITAQKLLLNCNITPENIKTLENGLGETWGTIGIVVQTHAFEDILNDDRFRQYHNQSKFQFLRDYDFQLNLWLIEGKYYESLPFDRHTLDSESINVVMSENKSIGRGYYGHEQGGRFVEYRLSVPPEEACKDLVLRKSISWWTDWQRKQLVTFSVVMNLMLETRKQLSEL